MALDPVPTWIHGAKHSGDILRQGTFNETGGSEGVSSPTAFRVRATQTPSNKVRVDPGGLLMLSPWDEGQTYSMRNASETLVEVPASSSLSANTWYINAWINDPNKPGGTTPVSKEFGPYNFLTCDSEPKDNNPAYACAEIVVPKNEATIVQDYITDLREIAQPHRENVIFARPRIADDDDDRHNYVNTRWKGPNGNFYGEAFPGGAGSPNSADLYVPEWATHQSIRADWIGVRCESGKNTYGHYWMEFGDEYITNGWPGGRNLEFATQVFAFDTTGTQGNYRTSWPLMDQTTVPKKLRGKTVKYQFKAGLYDTADTYGVFMNNLSGLGLEITFSQQAIDADTL